jgi:glycosyltransferase involved in cell wall biosynthesis
VIPGGLEHGGGIGRQMGYFLKAYQSTDCSLNYQVVDSRGPWFLGASPSPLHVARILGLRYVLHLHDYDYADYYGTRGGFVKRLIRTAFRHAAAVIVLGRRELELIPRLLDLDRDRVMVLHNAVADPKPDIDRKRSEEAPCQLLFLGHLSARKGVPDLLHALASPRLKRLTWRATLAGGGPIDEYRSLAKDLGILENLQFPGWVDETDVGKLCENSDVLVLPSYAEGLAMSVLEGLSYGLAVITTPVGAHLEVIEPEVSGILVPPGDVAKLADALARVIEDVGLRTRLGKGARNRFLEAFDIHRYAIRLGKIHAGLFEPRLDHPGLAEKGLLP